VSNNSLAIGCVWGVPDRYFQEVLRALQNRNDPKFGKAIFVVFNYANFELYENGTLVNWEQALSSLLENFQKKNEGDQFRRDNIELSLSMIRLIMKEMMQ
jgi:hypothetical protein